MITLAGSIIALLVVATITIEILLSRSPSPEMRRNRKRMATWWIIVAVCLSTLMVGGWLLTLFVLGLVVGAAYELNTMLKLRFNMLRVTLLMLTVVGYQLLLEWDHSTIPYFALPFLFLLMSQICYNTASIRNAMILMFCTTSVLSVLAYHRLGESQHFEPSIILVFLFFVTAMNDVAQYISGRLFGKHLIAPKISPNKTVEGALGGILATSLLSLFLLPGMIGIDGKKALMLGVVFSTLGLLGDLFISRIKRCSKTKDSGTLLPGHGGLLDRIDSLLLTAPGFALCILL